MLYEILKTSKLGASFAPDMYTALWAQKLARGGEVKILSGIPPLTFPSNGQPLLDYLISGNTVQSGTPTPDNPVMPQGTGERTANLSPEIRSVNGWVVGYRQGANGSYVSTNNNGEWLSPKIPVSAGDEITMSAMSISNPSMSVYFWNGDTYLLYKGSSNYNGATFTIPENTTHIDFALRAGADKKTEDAIISSGFWVMLNTGSTALPYQPYGIKIPISSAGQTTPVYLGEVETTRKVKKLVLTGDENWYKSNTYIGSYYAYLSSILPDAKPNQFPYCSHLGHNFEAYSYGNCRIDSNSLSMWMFDTNKSVADFKSYLQQQYAAGTPVTVWYVLATPETAVVNEPLMKIGDYADTLSMEQAGAEIPTVRGTNTLDVLTDVKPSEIYIKYKS